MKTMNTPALVVLATPVASALILRGDNTTRAATGGPIVKVLHKNQLKGNHMSIATGTVEKRDLVITRVFDASIDRVWKAWTIFGKRFSEYFASERQGRTSHGACVTQGGGSEYKL